MPEDNIYPASTEHFMAAPTAQIDELNAEKDQVLSNAPQIRQTIDFLNRQADFYDSKSSISEADCKKKEVFWHLFEAHAKVAVILRTEALKLESVLQEYAEE